MAILTREELERLEALVAEAQDVVRGFEAMQNETPALDTARALETGGPISREAFWYRVKVNTLSLAVDGLEAFVDALREAREEGNP